MGRLAYQGVNKVAAEPTRWIAAGSTRIVSVSMVGMLDAGETITGTPTVTGPDGVTISNIAVNAAELLLDDADGSQIVVPIGKAVQFRITGITADVIHTIQITAVTTASQTLKTSCQLLGVATTE